ncbi:endonuclease/exonuclease/phosphatase family protein [Negadavirga shengliensis]|uniref:Endonuclease/exonuclease/phosphatase family protein n=1 Tax=Negadavirga shengliensis TaxID=1389218 RepID=A0ABV9T1E8_9BACT
MTKKLLLLFFLLNSFSPLFPQSSHLKVISYNIWNGFDWGKDKDREQAMVAWLKNEDADVIGFQELNDFTQEKLEQLASQWGHPHAILLKEDGYPIGITSKTPLQLQARMLGGLWHGMLHVRTAGIDFLVVHLSPHDWRFRRREAEMITSYMENALVKTGKSAFMVLGDFNAHSPFDAQLDRLNPHALENNRQADSLRYVEKGEGAYQTLRDGQFDYSVMARFLSLPLIDVVEKHMEVEKRHSFPTPVVIDKSEAGKKQHGRIDYILVSPVLENRCIDAKVINSGEPEHLSDHYPVVAEFKWENTHP